MRILLLGFFLLAAGFSWGDTLDKILKSKQLRVGTEPGFLPFEMRTQKGELIGFDVEMMEAFAKNLGVEVSFVTSKWDGIIPGLMAKKYDLIVSGMTITAERQKAVLFSDPYYQAGLKVLMKSDLANRVRNLKDLDDKQYKLVVKLGTTGDLFASKGIQHAELRKLDSEADAAQAVLLGRMDAFIYDKPYLEIYHSSKRGKLVLLPDVVTEESFGVAARPKDRSLIDAFNRFLKGWKSDKVRGYDYSYKRIFEDMVWKTHFPNLFR